MTSAPLKRRANLIHHAGGRIGYQRRLDLDRHRHDHRSGRIWLEADHLEQHQRAKRLFQYGAGIAHLGRDFSLGLLAGNERRSRLARVSPSGYHHRSVSPLAVCAR
jgi:hypothetical protein